MGWAEAYDPEFDDDIALMEALVTFTLVLVALALVAVFVARRARR